MSAMDKSIASTNRMKPIVPMYHVQMENGNVVKMESAFQIVTFVIGEKIV